MQLLHISLEIQESFADRVVPAQNEVLHTIVTNHSAPECVVQVEDKAFL